MEKDKLKIEELLFNDEPITVNRKLAKCLGLTEAVIFQQIHYWLKINEKTNNNFKEGKYWTFNSISNWKKNEFDFLSEITIKRKLLKLESIGLLKTGMFNKMRGDKTKWYTIDYNKLLEVCENELSNKENLSKTRKQASLKGVEAKKKNKKESTIVSSCSNGGASYQLDTIIVSSCSNDSIKLNQPIPEITTKTTTKTSTCSSSTQKKEINLYEEFESNICELKKTTKIKYEKIVETYDKDMILAIIEECTSTNTKSFKGFESAFNSYIDRDCKTKEDVINAAADYRLKNKKTSTGNNYANKDKSKDLKFNDIEARKYDYDSLEKKLLGWG